MAIPPVSFYTFRQDLRPFGQGTPIGYKTSLTDLVEGEFVAWDATNKVLVRYVRDGSAGKFAGISKDSVAGIQKLGNQAALQGAFQNPCEVFTTGVHELLGAQGQTYKHGDVVYMNGTDTQLITTTAGSPAGVAIGTVHLPDGSTKTGSVRVPVLIDEFTIAQA
jgi:predicted RecA/RadA family phage recombinase